MRTYYYLAQETILNDLWWSKWQGSLKKVVVQLLSCVWLFVIPWTAAHEASLSFAISQSLLKFMSTESVTPSNHLILCCPLLLLPSFFPRIKVTKDLTPLKCHWVSEVSESCSVVSDCLPSQGLYTWNCRGQSTGVGSLFLPQGIFPTQGLNPGLLH